MYGPDEFDKIRKKEATMKAHQNHTKDFDELNFKEQAQSINAMTLNLEKSFRAHIRKAVDEGRDPIKVREKCVGLVEDMLRRV